ncbi:uncharacterized protein GLRG_05870 [Colletotrichum graminicola M1.001]|uniref:Uncharacterized protein n=1 Tax=Colletotrichum graminicola (strain M1.001 / M2 / FGSC 10212) TaxID=645133 RepID=E3QIB1_COLGM|nr:uncharacterized protein GLRG_05870 [Colletotrichum graminicola M1.001]EFQ30726.1 hypothetical protein GLRG_05870 [Colletotrichum graminicola M1.001]
MTGIRESGVVQNDQGQWYTWVTNQPTNHEKKDVVPGSSALGTLENEHHPPLILAFSAGS